MVASGNRTLSTDSIQARIIELRPWFHNLVLGGISTAPDHFLGDYPAVKWRTFAHALPDDLRGKTVLDIGCNAGFYSIEMKRRGADHVLAIDSDPLYLEQARFAARVSGVEIEFRQMSVYDIPSLNTRFDLVLYLGVSYHLRYPLLALDLIRDSVVGEVFVFQSMLRGSDDIERLSEDYGFKEDAIFNLPGFPKMHFVEKEYASDPTNWWIPNKACVEAMLRSSGFCITAVPENEVYICELSKSNSDHIAEIPAWLRR
jgi:tRNA (mo5U34)-methyltransferase